MTRTVEQAFAGSLRQMLEQFEALERKGPSTKPMAIQEVVAFLLVVEDPGRTVNEYAAKAGMSPTSMSRYLLDLGERLRTGEPGRNLVEGRPNLLDRRQIQYRPTGRGMGFMNGILGRLGK